MLCFKCLNEVGEGVSGLFSHLKYIHGVHSGTSTFIICRQGGCLASFSYLSSYKRHIISEHANIEVRPQAEQSQVLEDEESGQFCAEPEESHSNDATQQCRDDLFEAVSFFIASMKASSIPYSSIQKVIYEVEDLLQVVCNHLQRKLTLAVKDVQSSGRLEDADISKFDSVVLELQVVKTSFDRLRSQYHQEKYFTEKGYLVNPQTKVLGQSFTTQSDSATGGAHQKLVNDTYQYVPICKTIKKHLEQPGVMQAILDQQHLDDDGLFRSYRDGSYFQHKYSACPDVIIPILLYCDDYEAGNPLGSKKGVNKLAGFYVSLLCLPAQFQASLRNILLAACAKRVHVNKYGIDSILSAIVKDLNEMEKLGLQVSCESYTGLVKPVLFQVIGDNLGLHEMLGFVGSFSANYPCRFCKAPKEVTRQQHVEDTSLLRDKVSYNADLQLDNVSKTGIKRSSVLNEVSGFHVIENYVTDIMHDFLEGVIPLEMKLVLDVLIQKEKFTLQQLNDRLSAFSYGFAEKKNKPSPIQPSALINPSGPSGQKAAQMKCLALYLPLIIGDAVDETSDVWEMLVLLLDIYKIIVAPYISKSGTYLLKALIRDHHQLFSRLFSDRSLTPKQHHIIHYPRLIRVLGPMAQYSSMRKEGKHKPFKRWARACNNYKNIAKTLAARHQQQQSYYFLLKQPMTYEVEIKDQVPVKVSSIDEADAICAFLDCEEDHTVTLSGSICVQSYDFKPNYMVLNEWHDDGPHFAQVMHIMVNENKVYFVLRPWETSYYNRHRHAYAVEDSDGGVLFKQPEELLVCRPFHVTKCYEKEDNSWYIVTTFNLV